MAVPLLATQDPEQYRQILEQCHSEGGGLCAMEREVYDWDHAEVATWMCSEWVFSESIAAAVGGHHGETFEAHERLGPVSLFAWLRESEEKAVLDATTEDPHSRWGIPSDKAWNLIEPSFEKGDVLVRLVL